MIQNLKSLFYLNAGGRKRRNIPLPFDEFKNIVIQNVKLINANASNEYFHNLYTNYVNSIHLKHISRNMLQELGVFSKTSTNLNYYLSRGWNENDSQKLLSKRQSTNSLDSIMDTYNVNLEDAKKILRDRSNRKSKTFSKNYKDSKHKKFFRPSQIDFWLNKNLSENEAITKMNEYYSFHMKKFHTKRIENGIPFLTIRSLQYWLNKGLSIEDAHIQLQRIQDKRSKEYFIRKYGIEDGYKRFKEVNDKWLFSLKDKTDEEKLAISIKKFKNRKRYSNISIKLFDAVLHDLKSLHNIVFNKIHYKENEYFLYDNLNHKIYFYDFLIKDLKLIVEFNGILFHPNRMLLTDEEWKKWINPITKLSADQNYEYDNAKMVLAKSLGYEYVVVWENETFDNSKDIIIKKILEMYEHRNN